MKKNKSEKYINIFIRLSSWIIGIMVVAAVLSVILPYTPYHTDGEYSVRLKKHEDLEDAEDNTSDSDNSNTFVPCNEFDIKYLIKNYYNALNNGSRDELGKYVDDSSVISNDELAANEAYVEDYMDIQCYYMEGMMPGTYLVVAYSYVKFYGVYTTAPNIDEFYVCTNASGRYYISMKDNGDEIRTYNELMFDNSQISDMIDMARRELDNAVKYDSSIRELVNKINP